MATSRVHHRRRSATWVRGMGIQRAHGDLSVRGTRPGARRRPGEEALRVLSVQGATDARPQPSLRLFRAWLAAFNSGDRERYRTFLDRNFPSRAPLWFGDMGFRDFTAVRDPKGGAVVARRVSGWVQERDSDGFARFALTVTASAPRRSAPWSMIAIPRPGRVSIARLTEAEAIAGVDAPPAQEGRGGPGSAARRSCQQGRRVLRRRLRPGGSRTRIPNTLETRFRIGSMNKMFTAVATLQLVEAGSWRSTTPSASTSAAIRTER